MKYILIEKKSVSENQKYGVDICLSPFIRFVVSSGGWGPGRGKNESARRTMGRVKREREAHAFSHVPSPTARLLIFLELLPCLLEYPAVVSGEDRR